MFLSFFFSSRRRHTRCLSDWSSDVCSSDLGSGASPVSAEAPKEAHPSEGGKENKAPAKKTVAAPAVSAPSGTVAPGGVGGGGAGGSGGAPASSPQAEMFKSAAESGTPFCEICNCPPA